MLNTSSHWVLFPPINVTQKSVLWKQNQVKQVSVPQDFLQGAEGWVSRKDLKCITLSFHKSCYYQTLPLVPWGWGVVHGAGRSHPQPPTIHDHMTSQPLMSVRLLAYLGWWCWGGGWNHNSHPPPYLRSLRVAEFRICRCPAGVGILRILLICVSVVEGKWRGEIQNSPEKG